MKSFPDVTGVGDLHSEGSRLIAASITSSLNPTIIKYKDVFLKTLLSPARKEINSKPLVELVINNDKYDNI